MKTKVIGAVVAVLLAGWMAGTASADITVETVPVGNAGNLPDSIGYGAVSYGFRMGKYEVTAGQYCAFLNAVPKTDPYGLYNTSMDTNAYGCQITRHGTSGNYTYDFSGRPSGTEADWATRPVNYVSWGDAARFANWLSNGQGSGATESGVYALNGAMTNAQLMAVAAPDAATRASWARGTTSYWLLTSEDEWYKAAYHDKTAGLGATYFDYPTGSNIAPGRDMADASGNNANYYTSSDLIGSPYYRTEVGEFQNSGSSYGTFDQGGNLWEWNEAVVEGYTGGFSRGLRGGSYGHDVDRLDSSYRVWYYVGPSNEDCYVGFRVAQVPEPATLSLLALGGLAMIRRRRGR